MIQVIGFSLLAGVAGLWIAQKFIPGIAFAGSLQDLLIAGAILGAGLAIIRPILGFFTFLLRTALLAGAIAAGLWILDFAFPSFNIAGLVPLAWTTALITGIILVTSVFFSGKKS